MDNSFLKKDIPGPGSYAPYSDFGKTSKKMSFGSRTMSMHGKVSCLYSCRSERNESRPWIL